MQTSPSGTSTPATQTSRTSIKLEEQENGDVRISVSQTQNPEEAPQSPPKTPTTQENWGTTIGLPEMTATSPPYRSPTAWEGAERKQKEHDALHWTGCYNDNCWVHDSEKVARGWYLKKSSATRSGWNPSYETKAPAQEEDQTVQLSKNQQRKARHSTRNWKESYNDKCATHVQYKVDAGYYPQKDGTKKELSHWHRYHRDSKFRVGRKGIVGTRQEREGSEKTQPDIEALHRQIGELLDGRERSLKNEDNYRLKVADQQAKIGRLQEDVQGRRRTVAGSGFSLGRLKREVDDVREGNQELEHRNHELKKELRRAGRKLLDLGN